MTLSTAQVEQLITERANRVGQEFKLDKVHVFEEPSEADGSTLVVQIAARRPANQRDWTKQRLRFAQSIRDALLEQGDDRYPLVQVFGPEEWAGRDA